MSSMYGIIQFGNLPTMPKPFNLASLAASTSSGVNTGCGGRVLIAPDFEVDVLERALTCGNVVSLLLTTPF
ncbi:unnamed protein product [Ambrosiozyma monospora]|uniref:Unnamed protein product n=1 Tax=Ambrosiozyma monospora TaxID=43982 RepID=A0ACB5TWL3_AMBMO|nr:unnamed protein product [Ambrosiozyma monospora]